MNKRFYNQTRKSSSISRRLWSEKKIHLWLLYQILRQSYLAKEAMDYSGSHLLADHIYRNQPKGSGMLGQLIDRMLLSLPSAKAFRKRYIFAREAICREIRQSPAISPLAVLTIPSGIPRECLEVCLSLKVARRKQIKFHCLDLSDSALVDAKKTIALHQLEAFFYFHQGDALKAKHYPDKCDVISSTGLGEFLIDRELLVFYRIVYQKLKPNGLFITSGLGKHRLSDFLLRELAEIETVYRNRQDIVSLLTEAGFRDIQVNPASCSLQTLVTGRK